MPIIQKFDFRKPNAYVMVCADGCSHEDGSAPCAPPEAVLCKTVCTPVPAVKCNDNVEAVPQQANAPSLLQMGRDKLRCDLEKGGARYACVSVDDDDDENDGSSDDDGAAVPVAADSDRIELRLRTVAFINFVYAIVQCAASIYFNSLAMRADAFHTMSDVIAAALAAHCAGLRRRAGGVSPGATAARGDDGIMSVRPFGYARAEVVGALVNNVALGALCLYLALTALPRVIAPEPFRPSWTYVGVAAAGVGVNLLAAAVMLCCRAADAPPAAMPCAHGCAHHAVAPSSSPSASSVAAADGGARGWGALLQGGCWKMGGDSSCGGVSVAPVLLHTLFDAMGCAFVALLGLGVLLARGGSAIPAPLLALADPIVTLLLLVLLAKGALTGGLRSARVLLESAPEELVDFAPTALTTALAKGGESARVERLIAVQLDGAGALFATAHVAVTTGGARAAASARERVSRALEGLGAVQTVVQVRVVDEEPDMPV